MTLFITFKGRGKGRWWIINEMVGRNRIDIKRVTHAMSREKVYQRVFFFLAKTVVRISAFNFFGPMLTPILRDQI